MSYQDPAPEMIHLEDRIKWCGKKVLDILLNGDVTFACVVLGLSMICWGALAAVYNPHDTAFFSKGFAFEWSPWLWGLNHAFVGYGFIHCAIHGFPPGRSLVLGTYCCCVWTLIAVGRPSSSFSSGMTLNFVVIFMGAILAQRSGKHRAA
jgi:hypothetical protein